jgi:hypothetical protein
VFFSAPPIVQSSVSKANRKPKKIDGKYFNSVKLLLLDLRLFYLKHFKMILGNETENRSTIYTLILEVQLHQPM